MSRDDTVTVDFERFAELIAERDTNRAALQNQRTHIKMLEDQLKEANAKRPETEQFTELKLSAVVAKLKERAAELDSRGGGHHVDNDAIVAYGEIMFALRTITEFTGAK